MGLNFRYKELIFNPLPAGLPAVGMAGRHSGLRFISISHSVGNHAMNRDRKVSLLCWSQANYI